MILRIYKVTYATVTTLSKVRVIVLNELVKFIIVIKCDRLVTMD